MVCKGIRRNATPFVCTPYHSTLRRAIPRNSTLFECMLCYSTLRWAISPFVWTLCGSTLRWAISRNATRFLCTLCHSTLPYIRDAMLSCSWSIDQLCIYWPIWHPRFFLWWRPPISPRYELKSAEIWATAHGIVGNINKFQASVILLGDELLVLRRVWLFCWNRGRYCHKS